MTSSSSSSNTRVLEQLRRAIDGVSQTGAATASQIAAALNLRSAVHASLRRYVESCVGDSDDEDFDLTARDVARALRGLMEEGHPLTQSYGHDHYQVWSVKPRAKTLKPEPQQAHKHVVSSPENDVDARVSRLVQLTRRDMPFESLCNALDMSPSKVRELIERAKSAGYMLDVGGGVVGWNAPAPPSAERDLGPLPTIGGRMRIGVVSDLHAGSKYCLRQQIRDFMHYAYEKQGVRHFLMPGDLLDGCYKHGRWELTHHGLDEQMDDLLHILPVLRGSCNYFIAGNHDETFWRETGADVGRAMVDRWRASGRDDLVYLGPRQATVLLGGVRIELWHPKSGKAYSLSYHPQNHIRDYAVGQEPDILLAGHWHTWGHFEQRGVHALLCGTFQSGGSAFSKSLGGSPATGGTILSWERTGDGTLHRVSAEFTACREHEAPRVIEAA